MRVFIIYHRLFDYKGETLTVGGIQTYILNLAEMFVNHGIEVIVYQLADFDWVKTYNNFKVYGIKKLKTRNTRKQSKLLLTKVLELYENDDIVIWGTYDVTVRNLNIKSLAIQHGISFDYIPDNLFYRVLKKINMSGIYKALQRRKAVYYFLNTKYKVCVDYNFLNWIRTMVDREYLKNIEIIPNFSYTSPYKSVNLDNDKNIYILFARRFVPQRGVTILIEIIDYFIKNYNDVYFTIAGEGTFENFLKNKYENIKNVTITKYSYKDSLKIHSKHHISLIPTYGSEGTSFSLLESMSAGCVPIASNVGGMTNIILDGFNGFLVNPESRNFIKKIEFLIRNPEKRRTMSLNAKLSCNEAFSYEMWEQKWIDYVKNI